MIIEEIQEDDPLQDAQDEVPQGMKYLYMPSVYSNGNYKIPNPPVLKWLAKQQQIQHQEIRPQPLNNDQHDPNTTTTKPNQTDQKQEAQKFVPPTPPPPVQRVPKQQQFNEKEKPAFKANTTHIKNALQNFRDKKETQETKPANTWNNDTPSTTNWKLKETAWTKDSQWEHTKDDDNKKKWNQTQWNTTTKEHNWKPDNQQQAWKNTDKTTTNNWKSDDQQPAWKDTDTRKEHKWKQTEWHQNEPVQKPADIHNFVPEPTQMPPPPPPQHKQNVVVPLIRDKYMKKCIETEDPNLWQPPPYEEDGENFSRGEKRDLIPQNMWCTVCWQGVHDYNMDTHVGSKKHLKSVAAVEDNKNKAADQKPVVNIPKLFVPPQQFKLPTSLEQETKPQQPKKKRSKKHRRQSSTSSSESTTSSKKKRAKKKKTTHETTTQSSQPSNMQQQNTNTIPAAPFVPNYVYMQQPQQQQHVMQPTVWNYPQVPQIGSSMYSNVTNLQTNPQRSTANSERPLFGI